MKTVELFAGTQSFSKVMRERGHKTFCVDNNDKFKWKIKNFIDEWVQLQEEI